MQAGCPTTNEAAFGGVPENCFIQYTGSAFALPASPHPLLSQNKYLLLLFLYVIVIFPVDRVITIWQLYFHLAAVLVEETLYVARTLCKKVQFVTIKVCCS